MPFLSTTVFGDPSACPSRPDLPFSPTAHFLSTDGCDYKAFLCSLLFDGWVSRSPNSGLKRKKRETDLLFFYLCQWPQLSFIT